MLLFLLLAINPDLLEKEIRVKAKDLAYYLAN